MSLIRKLSIGVLTLAAGCTTNPLTATLSGAAETPAGDPAGTGKAKITFDLSEGLVC